MKEPVPEKPAVGVNVTEFPLTMVVPLVALTTAMLVEIPEIFDVKFIGAAAVLNAVWKGPTGTETVGGGGNEVRLMVTELTADDAHGPVAT